MAESVTAAPAQPAANEATAIPSAPEAAPVELRTVESLNPAERKKWRETGELPTVAPAAAPDAAADDGDAASPDAAKFVTTPPPPGVSKRQHERNELIRQATEERQRAERLEKELAALRTPPRQPDPAPQPPRTDAKPYDGTDPNDPRPTIDQFSAEDDPYRAHLLAEFKWEQRKEQRRDAVQRWQSETEAALAAKAKSFADRGTAYEAAHPGHVAKTAQIRADIHPQSPMAAWLLESEVAPQVLDHLADHPEDFARIARAASYEAAHAAFVKLETRFETSAPPAPADAPAAPTPKLVSSAPPPPPTLGTRPAEPTDEATAALKRGDFTEYRRLTNRALAAARTGR